MTPFELEKRRHDVARLRLNRDHAAATVLGHVRHRLLDVIPRDLPEEIRAKLWARRLDRQAEVESLYLEAFTEWKLAAMELECVDDHGAGDDGERELSM